MGGLSVKVLEIEIASIERGEQTIRVIQEDDAIGELAQDIATRGLLQPIGVVAVEGGKFQLLWGGRRLAAHVRLGRARILARVMPSAPGGVRAFALVENLLREQLTLGEEVEAVRLMHVEEKKSVESIAAAVSKSRSWVLNRLMVPDLEDFIRDPLLSGDLKLGHVEVLGQVPTESARRYLVACAIQGRWTKGHLKQVAEIYVNSPSVAEVGAVGHLPDRPAGAVPAVVWGCQVCGRQGELAEFVLVRVCANGCQSDPVGDRSSAEGGGGDGVEGGGDE